MASLSAQQLKDLVLGILNLVSSEHGFTTKTKLLKLLYLADVSHRQVPTGELQNYNP